MIEFNGKKYSSVEEMPPDEREAYEKAINMLKNLTESGKKVEIKETVQSTSVEEKPDGSIVVDGQEYSSVDEMPPEVRAKYEKLKNDLAGLLESLPTPPLSSPSAEQALPQTASKAIEAEPAAVPSPISTQPPVIQEQSTGKFLLVVAIMVVLVALTACAVLGLWWIR